MMLAPPVGELKSFSAFSASRRDYFVLLTTSPEILSVTSKARSVNSVEWLYMLAGLTPPFGDLNHVFLFVETAFRAKQSILLRLVID